MQYKLQSLIPPSVSKMKQNMRGFSVSKDVTNNTWVKRAHCKYHFYCYISACLLLHVSIHETCFYQPKATEIRVFTE